MPSGGTVERVAVIEVTADHTSGGRGVRVENPRHGQRIVIEPSPCGEQQQSDHAEDDPEGGQG